MSTQSCRSPDVLDPAGLRVVSWVGAVERCCTGSPVSPQSTYSPANPLVTRPLRAFRTVGCCRCSRTVRGLP